MAEDNVILDVEKTKSELLNEIYDLRRQLSNMKRAEAQRKKKDAGSKTTSVELNAGTVRNAVIFSEILGKPLSKRR